MLISGSADDKWDEHVPSVDVHAFESRACFIGPAMWRERPGVNYCVLLSLPQHGLVSALIMCFTEQERCTLSFVSHINETFSPPFRSVRYWQGALWCNNYNINSYLKIQVWSAPFWWSNKKSIYFYNYIRLSGVVCPNNALPPKTFLSPLDLTIYN